MREPAPFRKVNLELRDQYLEGKGVDASQALAEAMGSTQEAQAANKRGTRRRCWRRCRTGPPKGGTGPGRDQPMPRQDLDLEEGKLSLILWAMKRHQGELRMFGGIWKKHASGEIRRGADQQFKLTPEELLALERRTHPHTCEQDHIDPVIYTALEIRAQLNRGERPAPEQVVGISWAKGDGVFWTTWDLPSLTGVYAHRFTFKYIYSAWTVKTQRRGRNAEGSTSDMGNILQMRKEAVPFLESLGIPKPRSKEEWSYIFKEMGTFLAAKNFIVNCPLPVMEIPVAPIHDSKEALRFRAVCDERITLPLASLKAFNSVYTKLVAGLSKSSTVEVKVNWRCNVVHDWVEQVAQEAAGALYDRLGYSQDLIRQMGCSPPLGASGLRGGAAKEADPKAKVLGGADTTLRTPDQGTRRYPPITTATVTAVAGRKYINKHFPKETKHVFWASVECGLVLPSMRA